MIWLFGVLHFGPTPQIEAELDQASRTGATGACREGRKGCRDLLFVGYVR